FGPQKRKPSHSRYNTVDAPVDRSTRSIHPPAKPGSCVVPAARSIGSHTPPTPPHGNPPLLHTYAAPSGPMAAPFGPPPSSATTATSPAGETRDSVPRRISTSRTESSGIQTGPSGNSSPAASSRTSSMLPPERQPDRNGAAPFRSGGNMF